MSFIQHEETPLACYVWVYIPNIHSTRPSAVKADDQPDSGALFSFSFLPVMLLTLTLQSAPGSGVYLAWRLLHRREEKKNTVIHNNLILGSLLAEDFAEHVQDREKGGWLSVTLDMIQSLVNMKPIQIHRFTSEPCAR